MQNGRGTVGRERERMRGKGRSTVFSEVGIYINIYIKERL